MKTPTTTRKHAQRKPSPTAAPAPTPPTPVDPRDAVIKALQGDRGPLMVTIAGNMVTSKVQVIDNSEGEADMKILVDWLATARDYLQNKLLQLAEARGRAAAANQAPTGTPE